MVTAAEIEVQLGRLAQLVDQEGDRFLPFYELMESDLAHARARETESQLALSRAKDHARLARLYRDPEVAAMLA